MSNLIQREFKGQMFTFREDGYFNMTEAAKQFGKRMENFWANVATTEYLIELQAVLEKHWNPSDFSSRDLAVEDARLRLTDSQRGRNGGTWGHPKLAVFFARWLSPAFAVFCDAVIDDILNKKASLTIDKPDESFAMQVPKSLPEALRMAADLAEKNETLQLERDGVVKTVGQSTQTLSRFARLLPGVNSMKIKADLKRLGYLWRTPGVNGAYRVYAEYRDEYFTEKHTRGGRRLDIHVTGEGKALLGRLYEEGKLTMKKSFEK